MARDRNLPSRGVVNWSYYLSEDSLQLARYALKSSKFEHYVLRTESKKC